MKEFLKKESLSNVQVDIVKSLTQEEDLEIQQIQQEAFSNVSSEEVDEDFISTDDAYTIAKYNGEIVGFASIHHANVDFDGQLIKLGGFGGVCTREDMRGKGIALEVCKKAMEFLRQRGDDIAFLSIDTEKETDKLYRKVGFVTLPQEFEWENASGDIKSDSGGMIAAVNSTETLEKVLKSETKLFVGRGYW